MLHDCGLGPGDRVAIITAEKPAFWRPIWEPLRGRRVTPLNPGLPSRSCVFLLADSGASVVVAGRGQS